jgi:hypothetical protein
MFSSVFVCACLSGVRKQDTRAADSTRDCVSAERVGAAPIATTARPLHAHGISVTYLSRWVAAVPNAPVVDGGARHHWGGSRCLSHQHSSAATIKTADGQTEECCILELSAFSPHLPGNAERNSEKLEECLLHTMPVFLSCSFLFSRLLKYVRPWYVPGGALGSPPTGWSGRRPNERRTN